MKINWVAYNRYRIHIFLIFFIHYITTSELSTVLTIPELPAELWPVIASNLEPETCYALSLTSKKIYEIIQPTLNEYRLLFNTYSYILNQFNSNREGFLMVNAYVNVKTTYQKELFKKIKLQQKKLN